jgi:hypothetical protein
MDSSIMGDSLKISPEKVKRSITVIFSLSTVAFAGDL